MIFAAKTANAHAQPVDDDLKVYGVKIIKTAPWQKPFIGYGIYLGGGTVITAAHVVGNWPLITRPHAIIGGLELPTKMIRQGSFDRIDLALLSIDESSLPVSLRLRRNPLCVSAKAGEDVIDVPPDRTMRARTISPLVIAPELRGKYSTLITTEQPSGSGIFDAERRCLLGIVSGKIMKIGGSTKKGPSTDSSDAFVGYYVSAPIITKFLTPEP